MGLKMLLRQPAATIAKGFSILGFARKFDRKKQPRRLEICFFVSLDIIQRTNLASGTFYNYFDSKEAVFNALNNEIGAELRQLLRDVRQRATSFDSFIKDTFCAYFSYYAKNRENYMLTRSNRGRDGMNEVMQGPQVRAGLAELSDDIRQAIAEGVIPQLDVEFLTASLGGVAFSILDEMMEREPLDPEAAEQFATRFP